MKKVLYIIMMFVANMQCCFALDAAGADLGHALKSNTHEPGILSIIVSLLVVVSLIYITGLIYTKLNVAGANVVKEHLKNYDLSKAVVISTTQLGQNKNLHVIEINNQRMLIGSTSESISLIKDMGASKSKTQSIVETIEETPKEDNIDDAINLLYNENKQILKEGISERELPKKRQKNAYMEEEFTLHKKYL